MLHHLNLYIHHLHKCNEILGVMLLTWHNVRYYERLMQGLRNAIKSDTLEQYVSEFGLYETVGEVCECVPVAISCRYRVPLGTYTCKTAKLFVRDIESDEET